MLINVDHLTRASNEPLSYIYGPVDGLSALTIAPSLPSSCPSRAFEVEK